MARHAAILHPMLHHKSIRSVRVRDPSSAATPCKNSMIPASDLPVLALSIKAWGRELGFAEIRIADVDLSMAEAGLRDWLAQGMHGDMDYMASHGMKRARPAELVPGAVRAIMA